MITLRIDNHSLQVSPGTTVLEAAAQVGIEIPTLCYLKEYEPSCSCQVCLVKDRATGRFVPACATKVADGMHVDSETEEVHTMRRTALELLLSEHVGDCLAPCFFACPAHMDIPLMLQEIGDQDYRSAIRTIKKDIALPAVLGRVCSKPCEKGCRRNSSDDPVAVCDLKRHVADSDLETDDPYLPECSDNTGKRVAIIGAGATGLAAAYYLRQQGHECLLLEKETAAGGRLRYETSEDRLPRSVLDAEIKQIIALGIELRTEAAVTDACSLDSLLRDHDAVLIACGAVTPEQSAQWGVTSTPRGIAIRRETFETDRAGLFAGGNAVRGKGVAVRSVADGKEVAAAIGQLLAGVSVRGPGKPFSSRMGKVDSDEMTHFLARARSVSRTMPDADQDYSDSEAVDQSSRCLECGCEAHGKCDLERYAILYDADCTRFGTARGRFEVVGREGAILFEPGKCIKCERCVQIATRAKEPLGLTFVGRGFDVRLGVPFEGNLDEGLSRVAAECVAACPTAALMLAPKVEKKLLPILS